MTDPIALGFRRIKQMLGVVTAICLLAAGGVGLAVKTVSDDSAHARQQVCDRVTLALDKVVDAAAALEVPPGATPEQKAAAQQQVENFKATYHVALESCD